MAKEQLVRKTKWQIGVEFKSLMNEEIIKLKSDLDLSRAEVSKLREENSKFRSLMLSDINKIPTPDQIYLAQVKNSLKDISIETLLVYLDLFQAHAQIYAEAVSERKGKTALKEHLKNKDQAKLEQADEFRKNQVQVKKGVTKGAKNLLMEEFKLTESDTLKLLNLPKPQRIAVKSMMRQLPSLKFENVLEMLERMKIS